MNAQQSHVCLPELEWHTNKYAMSESDFKTADEARSCIFFFPLPEMPIFSDRVHFWFDEDLSVMRQ